MWHWYAIAGRVENILRLGITVFGVGLEGIGPGHGGATCIRSSCWRHDENGLMNTYEVGERDLIEDVYWRKEDMPIAGKTVI